MAGKPISTEARPPRRKPGPRHHEPKQPVMPEWLGAASGLRDAEQRRVAALKMAEELRRLRTEATMPPPVQSDPPSQRPRLRHEEERVWRRVEEEAELFAVFAALGSARPDGIGQPSAFIKRCRHLVGRAWIAIEAARLAAGFARRKQERPTYLRMTDEANRLAMSLRQAIDDRDPVRIWTSWADLIEGLPPDLLPRPEVTSLAPWDFEPKSCRYMAQRAAEFINRVDPDLSALEADSRSAARLQCLPAASTLSEMQRIAADLGHSRRSFGGRIPLLKLRGAHEALLLAYCNLRGVPCVLRRKPAKKEPGSLGDPEFRRFLRVVAETMRFPMLASVDALRSDRRNPVEK